MIRWLTFAWIVLGPATVFAGSRAYLGVELLSITPELRAHYGAPESSGVLLGRIAEDSPAKAAGLAVGDILVTLNGRPLQGFADAVRVMSRLAPGDAVEVGYVRDGKEATQKVILGEQEGMARVQMGPFQWRGPSPIIDERALRRSMQELQQKLGSVDGRKIILMERTRRGLEDRIRALEGKIAELEARLGEQT